MVVVMVIVRRDGRQGGEAGRIRFGRSFDAVRGRRRRLVIVVVVARRRRRRREGQRRWLLLLLVR